MRAGPQSSCLPRARRKAGGGPKQAEDKAGSSVGVVGWGRGVRDASSVGFACEIDDTLLFFFFFNLWFKFCFMCI